MPRAVPGVLSPREPPEVLAAIAEWEPALSVGCFAFSEINPCAPLQWHQKRRAQAHELPAAPAMPPNPAMCGHRMPGQVHAKIWGIPHQKTHTYFRAKECKLLFLLMSFDFLFYLIIVRIIKYNIFMINSLKILKISPWALPTYPWNILVIKDFECQAHGLNHINYPRLLLVVISSCSLNSFTQPINLCFKNLLWVRCCTESSQLLGKNFTMWWENNNDYYVGQSVYNAPL